MSDYSFMKTGFNMVQSEPKITDLEMENIEGLLALFISNATRNAAKYVELSGRNGITKEDIIYGLRYEVFEFLKNPNLQNELIEIKNELDEYSQDENSNEMIDDDEMIVDDNEIDDFSRIDQTNLDLCNTTDSDYVKKYHSYYDEWSDWVPNEPLEVLIKTAIDKIY